MTYKEFSDLFPQSVERLTALTMGWEAKAGWWTHPNGIPAIRVGSWHPDENWNQTHDLIDSVAKHHRHELGDAIQSMGHVFPIDGLCASKLELCYCALVAAGKEDA